MSRVTVPVQGKTRKAQAECMLLRQCSLLFLQVNSEFPELGKKCLERGAGCCLSTPTQK